MFRFFENLIDPYQRYDERAEFPDRLIPFYLNLLWPARWMIATSMALGLVIAVVEVMLIRYGADLVDMLTAVTPDQLWTTYRAELIAMIVVALLIRPVSIIADAFLMHQGFYAAMASLVRWRTHRKLLRQSVGFFSDDFAGRLANKQLQLAPALNDSVYMITNALWYALLFVVGGAAILAETDIRLLIPFAVWFVIYISIAIWFVPRVTAAGKRMAEARSVLAGRIVDSYTNIQTVKLFAHADAEEEYARTAIDDFRHEFQMVNRIHTRLEVAMSVLSTLLIGAVVGYAVWLWSHSAVTVGTVAAAVALVVRMLGLVEWIMWNLTSLFQNIGTVQEGMGNCQPALAPAGSAGCPRTGVLRRRDHVRWRHSPVWQNGRWRARDRPDHRPRREGWAGWPLRRRQIHAGQSGIAVFRPGSGPCADRRSGPFAMHAGKCPRPHCDGHAGHGTAASLDCR